MKYSGNIYKMHASIENNAVHYRLKLDDVISVNDILSKNLVIKFINEINCIKCGSITNKSYGQGYCYPCFISSPETEECVLRPELCRAHEGIARDIEYAKSHCLIDQYVYLSYTGNVKVGVTRETQIPTRWIDQGATHAIILAKVPNRYIAGSLEVALKSMFKDTTNWRNMLKETRIDEDLLVMQKGEAEEALPFEMRQYISNDDTVHKLRFPVLQYPLKVKSLNLDKNPDFKGKLVGIKGQYLIFEGGVVMNVRKHNGYKVELQID